MQFDFYLIGLGNPGQQYALTSHKCGLLFIEKLRAASPCGRLREIPGLRAQCWETEFEGKKTLTIMPQTFMNNSGEAAGFLVKKFDMEVSCQLFAAYDDLDLPLGSVRLRVKGSAGTHKGMASVVKALGSGDFPRIRFGIGPKPVSLHAEQFVLSPFWSQEKPKVESMLDEGLRLWTMVCRFGLELAISKYQPQ
ncbi:MAG: aminoacyl-tRNA hydrolase [Elusimicrobia bacterium]|nr:aminoacyl-tRNA hydrolase [Elusimicrobiota bacterium]